MTRTLIEYGVIGFLAGSAVTSVIGSILHARTLHRLHDLLEPRVPPAAPGLRSWRRP